jgi:hypothetical protein
MHLSGEQSEQLHKALLAAFPSNGELSRVVKHKLGENLEAITKGGSLSEDVLNLIKWLEARGLVIDFVSRARADNPGNEALKIFEEQHCPPSAPVIQASPATADASIKSAFERETRRARRQIRSKIPGLDDPLPRSETEWIEDQLRSYKPVLFTGDAGTGKSGVADSLAERASKDGKTVLFIDARRTAYVQNEAQLQQHLGLAMPLVSAIEEEGCRSRCRLIIEQLDSSIGFNSARVLVDLAIDCCRIKGVEIVVISRKREANEVALLQPLTREGFKEHTSYPLGAGDVEQVLGRLDIKDPSPELIELGRNLLNLELIGRIKQQQRDYDFSQVTAEVDLWEQYIETITERELVSNPQAARQVISEAMRLAKLGLNREDRSFILDYDINSQQSRLISWEVILLEEGRRYRFRHEKLQDYLYARDAAERTLMPKDVAEEINPFRTANVIQWMDKIYRRSGNEKTRERFLKEVLDVRK